MMQEHHFYSSNANDNVYHFQIVSGDGFRDLIQATLEIGSKSGAGPIDDLLPSSHSISNNIKVLANSLRMKLKDDLFPVSDYTSHTASHFELLYF